MYVDTSITAIITEVHDLAPSLVDRLDIRSLEDDPEMKKQEDDPMEVWSEVCRRAEDAVASARTDERLEVMYEWAGSMIQIANQLAGVACSRCKGAGERSYPSTATWRGGMGGASMTTDICDRCWGTGRSDRSGLDRRKIEDQLRDANRESSLRWFSDRIGANLDVLRKAFPAVAHKLRRARWKKYHEIRAAEIIAHALDEMSGKKKEEEEKP